MSEVRHDRGWAFIQRLLDEAERETEGMTHEQLVAYYADAGIPRADAEAHATMILKEREEARAEDEAAQKELERLERLSPEELDAELRAGGIDPERATRLFDEILDKYASKGERG